MIALVVGAPGSGKSYTSVSIIAEALRERTPVATNIELAPGWEDAVARSVPLWWLRGRGWRQQHAKRSRELVYVSADLDELFRVRLRGCGRCSGCRSSSSCRREGRGVMVLDEAHNWMNARTWDSDGVSSSKNEAVKRRLSVVRFFSQHRKLGWTVYLITQDEANIDRQVRTLFEYLVRLRNLKKLKVWGVPIMPVNFFLAIWTWNDPSASIVKRQGRRLRKAIARMYDSMALSHGLEDDALEPIWLPHSGQPPVSVRSDVGAEGTSSSGPSGAHTGLPAAAADRGRTLPPLGARGSSDLAPTMQAPMRAAAPTNVEDPGGRPGPRTDRRGPARDGHSPG